MPAPGSDSDFRFLADGYDTVMPQNDNKLTFLCVDSTVKFPIIKIVANSGNIPIMAYLLLYMFERKRLHYEKIISRKVVSFSILYWPGRFFPQSICAWNFKRS